MIWSDEFQTERERERERERQTDRQTDRQTRERDLPFHIPMLTTKNNRVITMFVVFLIYIN